MNESEMVVAGVDTHKHFHVLSVLDGLGRKITTGSFTADADGYEQLAKTIGDPNRCIGVGVEGTASYGAGLTRHLQSRGYLVHEVLRPARPKRRKGKDKNDTVDAERAARDVLADTGLSTPKAQDGWVAAVRPLLTVRQTHVKASTMAINTIKNQLITGPESLRSLFRGKTGKPLMTALLEASDREDMIENAALQALKSLASLWLDAKRRADDLERQINALMEENAPALLDIYCCGTIDGAILAVSAGDNPDRMKSARSLAALWGTPPVELTSGQTVRHRLNRGGDRQANSALYRIIVSRMKYDEETIRYVKKRKSEGKSDKEIIRCLKNYLVNRIYRALLNPMDTPVLPETLAPRRKALGLSQSAVARSLGVSATTVGSLERKVYRNGKLAKRYADLLEMEENKLKKTLDSL